MAKRPSRTDVGVQDDAALSDPGKRNVLLDQIARGGGKWVRTNVVYGKTAGGRDLSGLDALVDAAKGRDLQVQATLMADPSYMKSTSGLTSTSQDPKLWAQFASAVAAHERGRIGRYSIGNEPNYPTFMAGADKDPRGAGRAYRGIYRAGRQAIKAADHGASVLLGELTPGGGDPAEFLRGVLGGKPIRTEGLAYHPYKYDAAQRWDIDHLQGLQDTLARYARQGKLRTSTGKAAPLFLTEFGYQRGDTPEPYRQKLLRDAYSKAQKAGAKELLYYQLAATPRDAGDPGSPAAIGTYGQSQGGSRAARAPDTSWKWDTAQVPDGNLEAFVRQLVSARPRARSR